MLVDDSNSKCEINNKRNLLNVEDPLKTSKFCLSHQIWMWWYFTLAVCLEVFFKVDFFRCIKQKLKHMMSRLLCLVWCNRSRVYTLSNALHLMCVHSTNRERAQNTHWNNAVNVSLHEKSPGVMHLLKQLVAKYRKWNLKVSWFIRLN